MKTDSKTARHSFNVLAIFSYWNVGFLCSYYRWKQDSETYDFPTMASSDSTLVSTSFGFRVTVGSVSQILDFELVRTIENVLEKAKYQEREGYTCTYLCRYDCRGLRRKRKEKGKSYARKTRPGKYPPGVL